MEDVIAALRAGLKKKGLSASAASSRAVGHPAFLKNLFNRRSSDERLHTIESLQRIAGELDLEFYLGPPRVQGAAGFAEAASDFLSVDGDVTALKQGFLPIPYHQSDRAHKGGSHLAIASAWLEKNNIEIEHLYAVGVASADMQPTFAPGATLLIDTSKRPDAAPRLFAATVEGKLQIGRIHAPKTNDFVMTFDDPKVTPFVFIGQSGTRIFPVGAVVAHFSLA